MKIAPLNTINKAGTAAVCRLLADDPHLLGLFGAVVYAGNYLVEDTPNGTHFYLQCPNSKTAQELIGKSLRLFLKFYEVFPISRLLISTISDPFHTVPPDDWNSLGAYQITSDLYLGHGTVKGHPDWYAVVKLDEDGFLAG